MLSTLRTELWDMRNRARICRNERRELRKARRKYTNLVRKIDVMQRIGRVTGVSRRIVLAKRNELDRLRTHGMYVEARFERNDWVSWL